ncbi:MAG: hypothetical protein IJ779_07425 [Ruminococcus sp.]|nr:hypothetical protein [Ruminococcus sp.]
MILAYIYNNRLRLEENVRQLQANVRYRRIDLPDCVELLCAQHELETFLEVTNQIRAILNLGLEK